MFVNSYVIVIPVISSGFSMLSSCLEAFQIRPVIKWDLILCKTVRQPVTHGYGVDMEI